MQFSSRGDEATRERGAQGPIRDTTTQMQTKKSPTGRRFPLWPGVLLAGIVLLGLLALFFLNRTGSAGIDSGKYQAVFLTNGQVYFGKLSMASDTTWKLADVYYLQAKNKTSDSSNPQNPTASTGNDVELIKLGNEVHGPEDAMYLNRDQTLFFENIRSDGTVGKSIANYLKNKKN